MIEAFHRIFRTAFFRITASALGFLTVVITSRYLGPEGRGILALFMNTVITIVAFSGSFQASIVHFVGARRKDHRAILENLIFVAAITALVSTGASLIFPALLPHTIAIPLAVFFFSLVLYMEGLAYARDHLLHANLFKSLPSIISFLLIATVLILLNRREAGTAIWMWTLGFPLTLLLMRACPPMKLSPDVPILKMLMSHGIFVALSTFISRILYRIDFFYLSKIKGDAIAGIYSVSMTVADINFLIFNMITTAFMGKMAGNESRKYVKYSLLYLLLMEVGYTIFLFATGKALIPMVFGQEFGAAFVPALILSIAIIFYTMGSIMAIYLNVRLGKTHIPFAIAIAGLIFKGAIAYPLVERYGMTGGAISSLISYALTFVLFAHAYLQTSED